jgi:ribosomal protein S18 acetylase RimI-like enzyme
LKIDQLGLGWRSDLLACGFGGEIVERDDCIVVRSPSNPTYYWGNFLILPEAPRDSDLAHWLRRFDEEIARRQPDSQHLAFGVNADALPHALPSWRAAGIDEFDDTAVLTLEPSDLTAAPAVRDTPGLVLRTLDLTHEIGLAVEAQVRARDASFDADGYRIFRHNSMQRMAAMQQQGIGEWFGAMVNGALAADCGLVHSGPGGLGRFQYVETQAEWRRRGLCRALVHHVCSHAFDTLKLKRLAMCADPHDVAIGIYRSVGFTQVESHWCLQRRPPSDRR